MISIVIPTLNEEKAIGKTLHSLKALSLPHEIIVTDGGSTDNTVTLAKKWAEHVVFHPTDKKQNIASNRNNGASFATGKYLVFIDSDCIINDINHFFTQAIEHFEKNRNLVGFTVWVKTQPDLETWADNIILGAFNYLFLFMNNVLGIGAAVGKFQMVRRDVFEQIGGFDEHLVSNEDHDLFRRLSKIGKTKLDPTLFAYHSNRRAHKIGWPRLLWIWTRDTISVFSRGKSASKEWTPIR
ncbi:MAG: aglE 2 [Candidatus Paceibacter sp.]|jgi:glycosyltransferase involved in cell wall biosynthesis|nr:aglE 2 [Candidatus Paceibacter sp.]